jgi:uncharacterized protein YbjQ (UPF0145 family)
MSNELKNSRLPIFTTEKVTGFEITHNLGLVKGNTIRARNVGVDILAVFKTIVGGEIDEYTKMMAGSREQALDRMSDDAKNLGADAIIGVRFSTSMIMQGTAEILAFGTAIRWKKIEP